MNKEILLSNSDYFEIGIGKRVTKKQIYKSDGIIPVYSANVFKPFGYLITSNLDDFEHDYILWGIDGNFEFNIKEKHKKFATTDHCGTIKILDSDILPEYLLYQLELKKHELGFDRTLRASLSNMDLVSINIPFVNDKKIDVKKQQEVVSKYNTIKNMKNQIKSEISELDNTIIELDEEAIKTKSLLISQIFDFPATTTGITRTFCNENKGTIPVFQKTTMLDTDEKETELCPEAYLDEKHVSLEEMNIMIEKSIRENIAFSIKFENELKGST